MPTAEGVVDDEAIVGVENHDVYGSFDVDSKVGCKTHATVGYG